MNFKASIFQNKKLFFGGTIFALVVITCTIFFLTQDIETLRDTVRSILEKARGTSWSFPLVLGLYLLSSLIMFPIIALNLATAMVFGPVFGFIYAFCGTFLSALVFFCIGRFGKNRGLKKLLEGPRLSKLDKKLHNAGIIGVATLRLIPMAPFGIFNMAAGITSVMFVDYIIGTSLAFLPGGFARAIVGDSLTKIILEPSAQSALYLGIGIVLWIVVIIALQFLVKKYRPVET